MRTPQNMLQLDLCNPTALRCTNCQKYFNALMLIRTSEPQETIWLKAQNTMSDLYDKAQENYLNIKIKLSPQKRPLQSVWPLSSAPFFVYPCFLTFTRSTVRMGQVHSWPVSLRFPRGIKAESGLNKANWGRGWSVCVCGSGNCPIRIQIFRKANKQTNKKQPDKRTNQAKSTKICRCNQSRLCIVL